MIRAARAEPRWEQLSRTAKHFLGRVLLYTIVTGGAVIFIMPFLWMLSTSVKPENLVREVPIVWIPPEFEWSNYIEPWSYLPFARFYANTVLLTVINVVGILISASLVAFGFARIPFKGRDVHFLILLSTLMLPGQVKLIPTYFLWSRLGAINTYWPLIVPLWLSTAYDVFLLRQFFMTIPHDLDDAARIDGCGWFGIYRYILLPLAKPALGVLAILNFSWNWNNFFEPLVYLNEMEKYTVSLGLTLFQTKAGPNIPDIMAMTVISMIPVIITFFIAQRYFIQGIVITGSKG
ncbi:MAG: sugar ABC transporter permease [Anaerolineae bacterium]|nr:MAG: sugar ABC transporter permease [Anaerolineae bacterium]